MLEQLKEGFSEFGRLFREDAEIVPAFSPETEEEFSYPPEVREEESLLATAEGKTWVASAEPVEGLKGLIRDTSSFDGGCTAKYFVDGSVRSVRTCDGITGSDVFPIVVAQVGAASIGRRNSCPYIQEIKTDVMVLLPMSLLPDTTRSKLSSKVKKIKLEDTLDQGDSERDYTNLRSRATRRARLVMAKIEGDIVKKCIDDCPENEYIILDGSLFGLIKEAQLKNLSRVIGVSKSFSMRPLLLAQEMVNTRQLVQKITQMGEGQRTFAFELHIDNDWVVTWYQRIRPRDRVDAPLDGIVKVEVRPENYECRESPKDKRKADPKWSSFFDQIAQCVHEERFPVPYHEERWHTLLYPIYCCEQALKSTFLSVEVLRGLSQHFHSVGGTRNGYR